MELVQFSIERRSDTAVLRVRGSLDAYDSADLESWLERLLNETAGRLVVDLSAVAFVDTTSAGALTRLGEIPGGHQIELVVQSAQVARMLDALGLTDLVPTTIVLPSESIPA
ncbi:MAG TPA: STAS domain-containing protein [Actinomycetota bacterium]|nr:STAS domain-containing protein [Actinomycetota bacterium]